MNRRAVSLWLRVGFICVLAVIMLLSPTMPSPLKLVFGVLIVGNIVLTFFYWRMGRAKHHDDDSAAS